jgi:hypothetical protein
MTLQALLRLRTFSVDTLCTVAGARNSCGWTCIMLRVRCGTHFG